LELAKISGVEYKRFKLFLLSLLWRASISTRPFFELVKLELLQEEKLRKMLYEGDPGEQNEYPCVICIVPKSRILWGLQRQPLPIIKAGKTIGYQFLISGVLYCFHTAEPLPELSRLAIGKNDILIIPLLTGARMKSFEDKIFEKFGSNKNLKL